MIFKKDVVLLSEFAEKYGCSLMNFYTKRDKMHTKFGGLTYLFRDDIIDARLGYSRARKTRKTKELYLAAFEQCTNLKGCFHISSTLQELGHGKQNYYHVLRDIEIIKVMQGTKYKLFARPTKGGVFEQIFNLVDDGYTAMSCEKDDEYMDYMFRVSGQRWVGLWK